MNTGYQSAGEPLELEKLASADRVKAPYHHIDPGFINERLCLSTFGEPLARILRKHRRPKSEPMSAVYNDHVMVDAVLAACSAAEVRTLGEVLEDPREDQLFCSTETLAGNERVYEKDVFVRNNVILPYDYGRSVVLEFHTRHFVADTGRAEQAQESKVAVIGGIRSITDEEVLARPLIMGAPSFDHTLNRDIGVDLFFHGWTWYEVFPGDIDEFAAVADVSVTSTEEWTSVMENLSEEEVKQHICAILSEVPKKDWGGEFNDLFASDIHLSGGRVAAAFVLKGPAKFKEMTPDMLGLRADQIRRMALSPADLLVVQHCHHIGEAVRDTLRAFAVAPHNPRRYCLIDGKDTYRILKAYGRV